MHQVHERVYIARATTGFPNRLDLDQPRLLQFAHRRDHGGSGQVEQRGDAGIGRKANASTIRMPCQGRVDRHPDCPDGRTVIVQKHVVDVEPATVAAIAQLGAHRVSPLCLRAAYAHHAGG